MDRLQRPLVERVKGSVYTPDQLPVELLTNFGHIHHWTPRFVVEPESAADVLAVVRFAREHGLSIATRGSAHSQSELGISRGGILLSMKSLRRVLAFDEDAQWIDVEPGLIWRDLVHRLERSRLLPPVLTNNLGVTVGGTLSMAGIGVASFKHGSQGDNVIELDVVTGAGELLTCSAEENADLFWATIAGLGQVAIITRARLRLRPFKPMTRTYYLLYDDLRAFLEDARGAMAGGKWEAIESWASPCPQGTKPVIGRRQVFARWFYPCHLTVEYDHASLPHDADLLGDLHPYANLYTDDVPTIDFMERLVPVFELWKRGGTWEHVHPWMEIVLPWESAADYIDQILPDLPPSILVGGHVLVWPARAEVSRSRLFMRPEGENVLGFGILPAVPPKYWDDVRPTLENASRLGVLMGGKRYLSGFVDFTSEEWRQHYGDQWEFLARSKRTHDPDSVLNPGFIRYGEPDLDRAP